jgi:hypothetical protein
MLSHSHVRSEENVVLGLSEEKSAPQDSRYANTPKISHRAISCYDLNAMETPPLKIPRMPSEYYRRQAARVRNLARDATTDAVREHLVEVALQYEKLADGAEVGHPGPARFGASLLKP